MSKKIFLLTISIVLIFSSFNIPLKAESKNLISNQNYEPYTESKPQDSIEVKVNKGSNKEKSLEELNETIKQEKEKEKQNKIHIKKEFSLEMLKIAAYFYPDYNDLLEDRDKLEVLDWNSEIVFNKISALTMQQLDLLSQRTPLAYQHYDYQKNKNKYLSKNEYNETIQKKYEEHASKIYKLSKQKKEKEIQNQINNKSLKSSNEKNTVFVSDSFNSQSAEKEYKVSEKNTKYNYSINTDELVDPLYHTANQQSVDLYLPGKNGLDFSLIRKYNSLDSKILNPTSIALYDSSTNVYNQHSINYSSLFDEATRASRDNFIATGWSLNIPSMSRDKIEANLKKTYLNNPCSSSSEEGSCESVWYFFEPESSPGNKVTFTLDDGNTYDFNDKVIFVSDYDYSAYFLTPINYPYKNVVAYKKKNININGYPIEYIIKIDESIIYVFDENGRIKSKSNQFGDQITYYFVDSDIVIKDSYERYIYIIKDTNSGNISNFSVVDGNKTIKSMSYDVTKKIGHTKDPIKYSSFDKDYLDIPYWQLNAVYNTTENNFKQIASYTYKDIDINSAADYNLGPHGYWYYAYKNDIFEELPQHEYYCPNCSRGKNNVLLWPGSDGIVHQYFETTYIDDMRTKTYAEIQYLLLDSVNYSNGLTVQYSYRKYLPTLSIFSNITDVNTDTKQVNSVQTGELGAREYLRGTTRLFMDEYSLQYISYHEVEQINYSYIENGSKKVLTENYTNLHFDHGYNIPEFWKHNKDLLTDTNPRLDWSSRYGNRQVLQTSEPAATKGITKLSYKEYELHKNNENKYQDMVLITSWIEHQDDFYSLDQFDEGFLYGNKSKEYTSYGYQIDGKKITNIRHYTTDGSTRYYLPTDTSFQYDDWGSLTRQEDPLGNVTTYEYYGPFHKISKAISKSKDGKTSIEDEYIYYPAEDLKVNHRNQLKKHITTHIYPDPADMSTNKTDVVTVDYLEYDSDKNVLRVKESATGDQFGKSSNSTEIQFTYTNRGLIDTETTKVTLENDKAQTNLTIDFDYDAQGRVTKALYPDGNYITYTYDQLDRLTSENYQPKGGTLRTTSYQYDDLNRKTTSTLPTREKREVLFTPFGLDIQSKRIIGSEEKILETKESYNGIIANKSIPFGNENMATTFEYDSQFRLKSITDPLNQQTTYRYSNVIKNETTGNEILRNTVEQVLPDGKKEITFYDEFGRRIKIIELSPSKSKERTTYFTYSPLGQVLEQRVTSKGKTQVTSFGYDAAGNLTYVKDDLGQEYRYIYDRLGNLLQITKDGKVDVENKYNEIGWRLSKVQPDGVSNTFSYYSNGLLANEVDKNGNTHEYSYEPTYELKKHQIKDQSGNVIYWRSFSYDDASRLVTNESNSENESISYTFDKWSRPETFTIVNRNYKLGYDDFDRMDSLQYPDGYTVNYTFDDVNRIQSVTSPKMGTVDYQYELSEDNHQYTIQYPNNMKQQKSSDSFGELKDIKHFDQSDTPNWTEKYGYDGFGNIETIDKNGKQYKFEYDGLNRISKENSVAETSSYTYDPRGNRQTLQTTREFQVPSSEYRFNAVNQLTSFTMENGKQGSFTYYPNGLRATKTSNNETTRFIYLNGVVIEELDGNGNVKAQNIWGNELLHRSVTGGKSGYYFYNGHGDVVEIKDDEGNRLNQYDFDIWGNIVSEKEDPQMNNPFLYAGEMYDKETGLYYLRARYYDPGLGRFINEDTYEGELDNPLSLNLYSYVENNPLIYQNPDGHDAIILTAKDADGGFGHTSAMFQDANGTWYYTYWGNKAILVEKAGNFSSLDELNKWIESQSWSKISSTNYTSSTYIAGDFTKSLDFFKELDKSINDEANKMNNVYNLITYNCLIVTLEALQLGVLNDGTSVKEFLSFGRGNVWNVVPNSAALVFETMLYNTAFTLKEYNKQLNKQLNSYQSNWFKSLFYKGKIKRINSLLSK